MNPQSNRASRHPYTFPMLLILMIGMLVGVTACGPSAAELASVDYTPTAGGDWDVSTPEAQDLDPELVARLYLDAEGVETIRSLLVVKNGKLIAEKYFHGGSADSLDRVQSVTKSFTSALVGIAIEQGCLASVDQKAIEFFPEQESRITDTRKRDITVQHLLQMRAGFPWEESSAELFELMYSGFRPSVFADVPLVRDPSTGM
jgi:CubicO group peptidase (beta-lactamase class C family)